VPANYTFTGKIRSKHTFRYRAIIHADALYTSASSWKNLAVYFYNY